MAKKVASKTAVRKPGGRSDRAKKPEPQWGGIRSEAVQRATGRSWDQWCKVLDKDKAASLSHKEIAELVHSKHGVGPWWSQMVTVGYEQARGLRAKHQKPDGFSISASRVFAVAMPVAFRAVNDAGRRAKWMSESVVVTKATPGKSVRMKWPDGSRLVVNFWNKSTPTSTKTQIVFQHEKLKNATEAASTKAHWALRLDALGRVLGV